MNRDDFPPSSTDWDLDDVIARLSRPLNSPAQRWSQTRSHVPLPSREALGRIIERLRAALFPFHFGDADLDVMSSRFLIGHALNESFHGLQHQIR